MRRESIDQAEQMARQRVQYLGEELRSAGLLPPGPEPEDNAPGVTLVRGPGRHTRSLSGPSARARIAERVAERLPFAPSHLTVLVAIAAAVLVAVAWVRISATSSAVPVPRAHSSVPFPTSTTGTSSPSRSPSALGSPAATGNVVVDVTGKVRRPGVATLPAGSRVIDAIRHAGGARGGADLTTLNLARVLLDGEQILVGVPGGPASAGSAGPAATPGAGGGQVSLNQASLEQLESLPGVGPVTAQKIIDFRTAHGSFGAVDELLDVDGIGDKTLAELAPHLTL